MEYLFIYDDLVGDYAKNLKFSVPLSAAKKRGLYFMRNTSAPRSKMSTFGKNILKKVPHNLI
jgi:hypothetical protein